MFECFKSLFGGGKAELRGIPSVNRYDVAEICGNKILTSSASKTSASFGLEK